MRLLLLVLILNLQSCKTVISGNIMTPEGQPISSDDGKVNISRLDIKGFTEIVSIEQDGSFSSEEDIEPGEYLIEPLIPGYQSNSMKVHVLEDRVVKLQAIPLPGKRSKAIRTRNTANFDQGSGGAIINPPRL